eukprot:scaffold7411_cov156-Skeletonema_menzelii.AAC.3
MIITRLLRALMRCIVSCQTFLPAKVLSYHPTLWIDFNFVVSHANSGSCSSANVVMTHRQLLEPQAVTYKSYADALSQAVIGEIALSIALRAFLKLVDRCAYSRHDHPLLISSSYVCDAFSNTTIVLNISASYGCDAFSNTPIVPLDVKRLS